MGRNKAGVGFAVKLRRKVDGHIHRLGLEF